MRVVAVVLIVLATPASARTVRGLVYDDANRDGRPSVGEVGIAKAVVAYDHVRFVETAANGEFTLDIPATGNGIIWVRVPDGFMPGPAWARVPTDPDVPVDIGLRRHAALAGPTTFVIAADTHLSPIQPFANDLAAVVADATALDPAPAFFTILGDITQGNEHEEFDLVDANLAGLAVPYVPVPGNHDWYDDGETWFARYGPDNYSFDIANVHFVVWNMSMPTADIIRYLGAELARVSPEMTVVALTHAPPVPEIVATLKALGVDIVLSGHTHTNRAVDHGGLVELTTEPLLMGGLDLTPAGYRVATIDRGGALSTYHRTVVSEPQLAVISPPRGACVPSARGALIVAAELDAGTAGIEARVDCGTPIALRYAGGWTWRAELPALRPGTHALVVDARTPSGKIETRRLAFEVCTQPALAAPTDGWPQLGGSARHTNARTARLTPPLAQRWATTVGGHVLQAQPVIANGMVFVAATDLGDGKGGGIVALDLATGATRWRFAAPQPVRGSPAVTGGVVAFGQLDGTIIALDAQTGERRWSYDLGANLTPEAASLFASVTADGDHFVVGNQRHLAVLASDRGAMRWRADPVPDGGYSQSLAAVAVGDAVAVGVFHRELGGLVAWDRASGRERWRATGELVTAVNASPVIANDLVYVVSGMTDVTAYELAAKEPVVRWTTRLDPQGFEWGNATVGTPAVAGGVLVVPTLYRDLVALDANTGAERWRFAGTASPLRTTHYRGAREPGFEASPLITGDLVWAVDTAGRMTALALATGERVWSTELGTPVLAGPAVAGDWLVVASYDGSVRAFAPSHSPVTSRSLPSCEVTTPASRRGCCDARAGGTPWLLVVLLYATRRRRRSTNPTASTRTA